MNWGRAIFDSVLFVLIAIGIVAILHLGCEYPVC